MDGDYPPRIEQNIDTERIVKFIEQQKVVIVKPIDEALGNGIFKLKATDRESLDCLFEQVRKGKSFLVEEVIENHKSIKVLHPSSLNTIRMVTCIDKYDKFHVVASLIRVGRGDSVIDNAKGGGMLCSIYPENGLICSEAYDLSGHQYKRHPDTGILFVGYQIPEWDKILKYTERLARHVPEAKYVGWDIVVKEDGLDVLEGNIPPDENISQLARGEGLWHEMRSYL